MARGITERDVHAAADALVEARERPTVERIRAHLGTGSPNTVTRHLESWWGGLGDRLGAHRASTALPTAPDAVVRLASQWWDLALATAGEHAKAQLAAAHEALADDRQALADQDAAQRDYMARARAAAEHAVQALALAEQRAFDLQRLGDQQRDQLADLASQRDALTERATRLESEVAAQLQRASEREAEQTKERQRHSEYVRTVEDRAHAEVDRIRQEVRALQKQLEAAHHERTAATQSQHAREEGLRAAVHEAQRQVAAARAEAVTLRAVYKGRAQAPARPRAKAAATTVKSKPARAKPASRGGKASIKSRRND